MHFVKQKMLQAMNLVAGTDLEALELVRYFDENGVVIEPREGHPLIDEIERNDLDGISAAAFESLLTQPKGKAQLFLDYAHMEAKTGQMTEEKMMGMLANPRRQLFGRRKAWHFPLGKLTREQLIIARFPSHADMCRQCPDERSTIGLGVLQLWNRKHGCLVPALCVSPTRCRPEWLGLFLFHQLIGLRWALRDANKDGDAGVSRKDDSEQEAKQRSHHLLKRLVIEFRARYFGELAPSPELFGSLDSRILDAAQAASGVMKAELFATALAEATKLHRRPLSEAEENMRFELFCSITCGVEDLGSKASSAAPTSP
jgi:hypothetical protein